MIKKKNNTSEIGYDDLIDRGLKLISESHNIIEKYSDKYKNENVILNKGMSFGVVVMEYHRWVNDIKKFFETSFGNKVESSFFEKIDSVRSFDWLNDNWYLDVDFISKETPFNIIEEANKKLERIREIARENINNKQLNEIIELDSSKNPRTYIDKKNKLGYLDFHNQKIQIGDIKSGKFKLLETLCNESFKKGKTIESVFEIIKTKRDKNKIDNTLNSNYSAPKRKLDLIKVQVREINRAISNHTKYHRIKDFNYRLSLKDENKYVVWLEEIMGRRG